MHKMFFTVRNYTFDGHKMTTTKQIALFDVLCPLAKQLRTEEVNRILYTAKKGIRRHSGFRKGFSKPIKEDCAVLSGEYTIKTGVACLYMCWLIQHILKQNIRKQVHIVWVIRAKKIHKSYILLVLSINALLTYDQNAKQLEFNSGGA